MTSDARTRDWLDPFTHQTYRAVPVRLADRLDAIAAPAVWRPTMTHSIELSRRREEIREQLKRLLSAFGHRVAYRRMIDEIHAGEDGLLPISEDRRAELRNLADTFAGLRDLDVVFAVQDGASVEDAALAAGIARGCTSRVRQPRRRRQEHLSTELAGARERPHGPWRSDPASLGDKARP